MITKQAKLPTNAPLVLLVEDNIIALRLVETIVSQAGCRYISATNGEKALELAKSMAFALIITDIGLPGISGTELTTEIRDWEKLQNREAIPIIGLTAHTLHESENRCLKAGMNKVLSKPIYLAEMQSLVLEFIKNTTHNDNNLGEEKLKSDELPLFDFSEGMKNIGNEGVLRDLLLLMVKEAIPEDLKSIQKAHEKQNWQQIEVLAHKMKSGALYCGAKQMQEACQSLERKLKTTNSKPQEESYQQLIKVVLATKIYLKEWLKKE